MKTKSNRRLLKFFGKLHLWLGLLSGLVVFIISIGAAVFVFEEDLTRLIYRKLVNVPEVKEQKLPLSQLWDSARAAVPGKSAGEAEIKNDPAKAYIFSTYQENEKPGLTYFSQYKHWDKIFVDPYTGKVLGVLDMRYEPVYLFRILHQQVLLTYDIGHWFTAIATLIFFVMILSGLVLWFPRNKAALKQRFRIKWKAAWRRKNYDVHNVGGFYTHLFILLFAATGLVWSFDWWTDGIYRLLGDNPEKVFWKNKHEPPAATESTVQHPEDKVYADMQTKRKGWTALYISLPDAYGSASKEISAYVHFDGLSGWDESDSYSYHPQTGNLFHQVRQEDKSLGEKWRNSNYAIHVGSIYGLPTKIIACLIALFCASLPLTGFTIWWGRRKKMRTASLPKAEVPAKNRYGGAEKMKTNL